MTESRIKAFFGITGLNQQKLIRKATSSDDVTNVDAVTQANAMEENVTAEEITHQLEAAVEAVVEVR